MQEESLQGAEPAPSNQRLSLLMVVNVDWFFLSHRLPVALAALEAGYEVTVAAIEEAGRGDEIRRHGLQFVPLPSSRGGSNPLEDVRLLLRLARLYRQRQPDVVHHVALKPVLYGTMAARLTGMKTVVNAVSGLGTAFIGKPKPSDRMIRFLYRFVLRSTNAVTIVQNVDDEAALTELAGGNPQEIVLIEGSGVDVEAFRQHPEPDTGQITIVLAARMLWDKGVGELVEAAVQLRELHGDVVDVVLAGSIDPENRSTISEQQLTEWQGEGIIRWVGHQDDMEQVYRECHIAVLPSYREGLPKTLIEAMAVGRPIVTTDTPGCRSVVEDGVNGFLVPPRDSVELAERLTKLIANRALREQMGAESRRLAVERFSLDRVVGQTIELYTLRTDSAQN